jgi:D-3-phosphoglycerate dehydrogenase
VFNFLLYETMNQAGIDVLEAAGTVRRASATDEDTIIAEIADIDGVVIRGNGRMTRRIMEHAPRLKVVGRHGVGVDNVDLEAATDHGIQVVNTPEATVEPVAEHAVAMMLSLSKLLLPCDAMARGGRFTERLGVQGCEMAGKTLGVVGFGRIGQRVAQICRLGLNMDILYADVMAWPDMEEVLGARRMDLHEMLPLADYVTMHVPLLPSTRKMMGAREFALLKPTAFFINTSRGPVVDEQALYEALKAKRFAGAGIDVYEVEPAPAEHPLFSLENTIVTPHVASSTAEALVKMSLVAEDVVAVLEGRKPRFPVNALP